MPEDLLDLKGRTALVTGAGQGVGRRVALRFAEHGAAGVVVNDLFADRAERVAAEVEALGVKALAVAADVSDEVSVRDMGLAAREAFGEVQILVNNAGVLPDPEQGYGNLPKFQDTTIADWRPWVDLNLYGPMLVTREFINDMVARKWGRVITVISDAARTFMPRMAAYGAAKAGAAGFMRCLAAEVSKDGVTANSVALGGVKTENLLSMMSEDAIATAASRYATRRLGEPEEVANAILFLASDAASWITGQVYPVNGGYSPAL